MTRFQRSRLKMTVSAGSVLWMVLVGWLMWSTLPNDAVENHASSAVKDRMALECQGSFRDRYECKESIIIESGRDTFFAVAGRFLLVIVPPMLATVWLGSYLRRHPVRMPVHHDHHATDWKARAQMHTQDQSPEEAARDLHVKLDDTPEWVHHTNGTHPSLADIAPIEDWRDKLPSRRNRPKE